MRKLSDLNTATRDLCAEIQQYAGSAQHKAAIDLFETIAEDRMTRLADCSIEEVPALQAEVKLIKKLIKAFTVGGETVTYIS